MEDFLIIKTEVPKEGSLKSYFNAPLITGKEKIEKGNEVLFTNEVTMGMVIDAVELEDCYELTIAFFSKYKLARESDDGETTALRLDGFKS